jgi:TRAP transporter TAXI family solute receptor
MASQGPKDLTYTTAGILGQVFNKKSKIHHLKITIEPLLNSFHTIQSVIKGETQFGIVGADKQYEAYTGIGDWEKIGSQKNLRSIFSLYDKPLTLLTTLKTRIKNIEDLKSKKVSLGEKESPLLRHVRNVLNLYNIQESEFQSHFFPNNEVSGKLQDEVVDAFFHIGHQPSNVIRNLSNKGRLKYKMLSFNGPEFETFIENHPYYTKSKIPKNLYPNLTNNSDIDSLGIKTTLITSSKIPEHVVYYLTKELFENMEILKSHFTPYSNLNEEDLFKGLSVPLHPGAIKYLKENGLLEFVDKKLI